jgi:hypothetical protein
MSRVNWLSSHIEEISNPAMTIQDSTTLKAGSISVATTVAVIHTKVMFFIWRDV